MIATNPRSSTMPNEQQSPINLHDPIFADLGDRKLDIQWPGDGHAVMFCLSRNWKNALFGLA
jgi:hypothetical protein